MPATDPVSFHGTLREKVEGIKVSLKVSASQLPLGNGSLFCRNQLQKLNWDCEITTGLLTKTEREDLYAVIAYHKHQTGKAGETFVWYMRPIMRRRTKVLIGFGDGSNKDFFLPNDYQVDGQGTFMAVYLDGVLQTETTHWSHVPGGSNDLGQFRFVTAPGDNVKVEASYAFEPHFSFVDSNGVMAQLNREHEGLFRVKFRVKLHTGQAGRPAFPQP